MRSASPKFDSENLGPSTVAWSVSHRLRSEIVGQDFLIEVSYPPVALAAGQKVPVVYVLDGNHAFATTALCARAIQSGPFPMPPTFVVGIGYYFERPEDQSLWGQLRARDMSPWVDARHEAQFRNAPEPYQWSDDIRQGGADLFLAFIENELKPFIEEHFPVDPGDQTLVGASLGGLFSLYTLLSSPSSFQRYVAISPAIYWDDRKLFSMEASLAERTRDLPAHLFLAAGSLEEAHDVQQKFVSNVYELDAQLRQRAYSGLELSTRIFEGETHMSVYPGAVTRGLGEVFAGYRDMHDWSRWMNVAAS